MVKKFIDLNTFVKPYLHVINVCPSVYLSPCKICTDETYIHIMWHKGCLLSWQGPDDDVDDIHNLRYFFKFVSHCLYKRIKTLL